jgi:hypothetical protein
MAWWPSLNLGGGGKKMMALKQPRIPWTISALLAACMVCLPARGQQVGGSGTQDDPYQIATADELIAIGSDPGFLDKHFVLTADIDLSGRTFDRALIAWEADGARDSEGASFTGSFDGQGHEIRRLHIQGAHYLGLFGLLGPEAVVSNLGLEAVDVNGTGDSIGGLAGESYGRISGCYCIGTVTGSGDVGGLVGFNSGGVSNCYAFGAVDGVVYVGGLVGYNAGTVANSYSTGMVTGDGGVGGLIGDNENAGGVSGCFWDVDASGIGVSAGGSGLTTTAMQILQTYTAAGWDFVDETEKSPDHVWFMPANGYPRLSWQSPGFAFKVGVYQLWSPIYQRHFYTISEEEKQYLIDEYAYFWTDEGIAYYALPDGNQPGTLPVYRFWDPATGGHFYTISEEEKDMLVRDYSYVWAFEGVAFYAYPEGAQPVGTQAVYRFWSPSPNSHLYTTSEQEKDALIRDFPDIWTYEGVAWYTYGLPRAPARTVWLPAYAPLAASQDTVLTFEWTYGKTGRYTTEIADPVTINYGDGTTLTGVAVTNLFVTEQGGVTGFVANDGASVKILGFEDPNTGEHWYASSDESFTSHPPLLSFSTITDGMMADQRGSYWISESDGTVMMEAGSVTLFQIQDITVAEGLCEGAVLVWTLWTDASFTPLDWDGMDMRLGIISPVEADTGGCAVAGVWIFARDRGPIAAAVFDPTSGQLLSLAELVEVQQAQ